MLAVWQPLNTFSKALATVIANKFLHFLTRLLNDDAILELRVTIFLRDTLAATELAVNAVLVLTALEVYVRNASTEHRL